MSREPEAIVEQRRQLGMALATFRHAAELSQARLGTDTGYDRTSINKVERGQQLPDRPFWKAADQLLHAKGALLKRYDELVACKREHAERQRQSSQARHQADAERLRNTGPRRSRPTTDNDFVVPAPLLTFPVTAYVDTAYPDAVQQHIWRIVELDNRFGGTDLARLAVRFFRSVHQQLGAGTYEPAIERDLQATAGEVAEVAGWLLYDADRQDDVRRMNQESLYFSA